MQKKKIFVIILILIIISIFLVSISILNERKKQPQIIEKTYNLKLSDAYTQYTNLSEEEKSKLGVVPRMYDVNFDVLSSEKTKQMVENTTLTSRYSLKDDINIKVENQGDYGTCWAFASLNSLETNLQLKTGVTYDFSESHIDHTMSQAFGYDRSLHSGGMFYCFMEYIMSDYGPVLENDVPYETEVNQYDSTDYEEWKSLKPIINLLEVVDMPTIDKKNETYTEEELTTFRNTVKAHIKTNGSVFASIYSDDIKTYNGKKVLNSKNVNELPNHAITVIGWDDDYAITNFPTACRPNSPGAYIVLNSWGETWGENGIFYVSYEDVFIEQEMSGVISTTTTFDYTDFQIQDEHFYQVLKQELNGKCIEANDETKKIKIKIFTKNYLSRLELEDKEIDNIEGIQGLSAIYYLNLSNNNLSNVSPILKLPNLGMFNISKNRIADFTDVFESSLQGLDARFQKVVEEEKENVSEINMAPFLYQAYYINGGTGVSTSAKIYYDCNKEQELDDSTGFDYSNYVIKTSPGTAKVTLDKEIIDGKPAGLRAIKVSTTDYGFLDGSSYIIYYDVPKGDINHDGKTDSIDAYITLELVESGNAITEQQKLILDMNSDGEITKDDAYLVLQKAVQ